MNPETIANAQVTEILNEVCQKKFGGVVKKLANWLGFEHSPSVHNWLTGTVVPAWVLLKIILSFPDVLESIVSQKEIQKIDPKEENLIGDLRILLKNEKANLTMQWIVDTWLMAHSEEARNSQLPMVLPESITIEKIEETVDLLRQAAALKGISVPGLGDTKLPGTGTKSKVRRTHPAPIKKGDVQVAKRRQGRKTE